MNVTSAGSHRFRCFTSADPARVWCALTDGGQIRRFLHGLVVESSWRVGAPLWIRDPLLADDRSTLVGRVLCVQPERQLSYFLQSGPADPSTYLTWQLAPCPGGTTVRLQVDRAESADTEEEAEHTWLPVLASLQALLSGNETARP